MNKSFSSAHDTSKFHPTLHLVNLSLASKNLVDNATVKEIRLDMGIEE